MTNSRRVETAGGAILLDSGRLDGELAAAGEELFDPGFWNARGGIVPAGRGRGAAWFIAHGAEQWVLRHYRRGGFAARLAEDRYVWLGEERVRSFAEYRLLACLLERGLPVPVPVAAGYRRQGPAYRCDLITRRIRTAMPLSETLAAQPLDAARWTSIGAAVGRLHTAGLDHADLNAHNILLDATGAVSIIDLDRGRLRAGRGWAAGNLRRLHRSLRKIAADLPAGRFGDEDWRSVLAGYRQRAAAS